MEEELDERGSRSQLPPKGFVSKSCPPSKLDARILRQEYKQALGASLSFITS